MLLAIDIGNTHTVIGVFKEKELLYSWRMVTNVKATADELGVTMLNLLHLNQIDDSQLTAIIISSVVPPLDIPAITMGKNYFGIEPLMVSSELNLGLALKCKYPEEIGADRLVNAVAAYESYGAPLIIVDFGTATTFCVISTPGEYLGGCIAPGLLTAAESLWQKAAKLPPIEVKKPATVICKETISSMQSGIFFGYLSLVEGLICRIKEELGMAAQVIATGGIAPILASESKSIDKIDPWLTLRGLLSIYEKNSSR